MTREDAIKEIEHTVECCEMYLPEDDPWILALNIAISALRAQQDKLDRSRWEEGCIECAAPHAPSCVTCKFIYFHHGSYPCISCKKYEKYSPFKFCQFCGRPLTEEAWAELERRINGGTDDV